MQAALMWKRRILTLTIRNMVEGRRGNPNTKRISAECWPCCASSCVNNASDEQWPHTCIQNITVTDCNMTLNHSYLSIIVIIYSSILSINCAVHLFKVIKNLLVKNRLLSRILLFPPPLPSPPQLIEFRFLPVISLISIMTFLELECPFEHQVLDC